MEIVQNSNGNLTVKCYDSEYPVGKKIEWSVKVDEQPDKAINSTNSDNITGPSMSSPKSLNYQIYSSDLLCSTFYG